MYIKIVYLEYILDSYSLVIEEVKTVLAWRHSRKKLWYKTETIQKKIPPYQKDKKWMRMVIPHVHIVDLTLDF